MPCAPRQSPITCAHYAAVRFARACRLQLRVLKCTVGLRLGRALRRDLRVTWRDSGSHLHCLLAACASPRSARSARAVHATARTTTTTGARTATTPTARTDRHMPAMAASTLDAASPDHGHVPRGRRDRPAAAARQRSSHAAMDAGMTSDPMTSDGHASIPTIDAGPPPRCDADVHGHRRVHRTVCKPVTCPKYVANCRACTSIARAVHIAWSRSLPRTRVLCVSILTCLHRSIPYVRRRVRSADSGRRRADVTRDHDDGRRSPST